MIAVKIFAYIFYAYGLTIIMVYGRGPFGLCEAIRNIASRISEGLGQLFSCPLCFSTWVGMLTSLLDILFFKSFAFTPFGQIFYGVGSGFWISLLTVLLDGFCTAGCVWLLYKLEEALEHHGVYYTDGIIEEEEKRDE